MKYKLLLAFFFVHVLITNGQKINYSIEKFVQLRNEVGGRLYYPSMNDDGNLLCFASRINNSKNFTIYISKKSHSTRTWLPPILVKKIKKISNVIIAPSGKQIFVSYWNELNDEQVTSIIDIDDLGNITDFKYLQKGILHHVNKEGNKVMVISNDETELFFYKKTSNSKWDLEHKEQSSLETINGYGFDLFYPKKTSSENASFTFQSIKNLSGEVIESELGFSEGFLVWFNDELREGVFQDNFGDIGLIKIFKNKQIASDSKAQLYAQNTVASNTEFNSTTNKPALSENKHTKHVIKPTGKYYALLIGISEYDDEKLYLNRPVQDVSILRKTLYQHYTFDFENILVLENPTRQAIIKEFYDLRNKITPDDNLLIFYAGHGYWDNNINQGYWWPKNAVSNNPSEWLSNSDIREQIKGINSAHTLLISDACFSGGIFRNRGADSIKNANLEIQLLYKTPSRRAITSGSLSTVPDESVFFDYLIKKLETNDDDFLPAQNLFHSLKSAVMNNSLNIPQEGVILNTGDEGGDFIFMKN